MATNVPATVATEPMQKASRRRPVSLMMRLPCTLFFFFFFFSPFFFFPARFLYFFSQISGGALC